VKLTDLLAASGLGLSAPDNPVITGITADSRAVKPGYLFAALPGVKADGAQYIEAAKAAGAAAILGTTQAATVQSENPRLALAKLATAFYGPLPQNIVAVTGTNGKTSTANFAMQLFNATGHKAAAIGTIGITGPGVERDGSLTTPDPIALAQDLGRLKAQGFDHVALEASSHGIDQYRLDGLTLKAAGFTYLGRDHLDYHGTLEGYFKAKAQLFERLLPAGGTAVLNADCAEYAQLASIARARGQSLISYGPSGSDLRLVKSIPMPTGLGLTINAFGEQVDTILKVTGNFQAGNVLCALGLVIGAGVPVKKALAHLSDLANVRGRLELVGQTPDGAGVYVDYAHTPDALETVLHALRAHTSGRLISLFGCGGNRDKGKRPQMGAISARLADVTYVTDDNPRLEEAAQIRSEILNAAPHAIEVDDRAKAIQMAVKTLKPGDTLVIAGKGHEQGQIVGTEVRPFDDAAIARAALKELKA